MTNKFRVRDTVIGDISKADYMLNRDGELRYINSDGTDSKPFAHVAPEYFTGFSDRDGVEIWQGDALWIPYNKQDRDARKRDGFIVTVDWDADTGSWFTFEMVGDTRMKHTPLYKMAGKARHEVEVEVMGR